MTCQCRSISRTFAASSTQRLVSQAHGHSGSNQKSTRAFTGALCTASVMCHSSLANGAPGGCPVRPQVGRRGGCSLNRAAVAVDRGGVSALRGKLPCVAVPNLTRDDAAARARLLAVDSYDVQFDLTDGAGRPGEHTFGSTTTVRFTCRQPGADTFIDLVAEKVRSATLNGEPLDVSAYTEEGGLPLPGLAAENTLVVEADCRYSNSGEGLHRFVDPEDGQVYLYTHFEPAEAKRVFTCFD